MKPLVNLARYSISDSPGHSAKYTIYIVTDVESKMVLDFKLIHVSEINYNSVSMDNLF